MNPDQLPTSNFALAQAIHYLELGSLPTAEGWRAIAAELRKRETRPLVDRALDRLTLHDVEGIVCWHGRVAVRRKNAQPAGWFLHTDDGSNCTKPHPETEHRRRERGEARVEDRLNDELPPRIALYGDPALLRPSPKRSAEVLVSPPDRFADYWRGQVPPPSAAAAAFARRWRASIGAGHPLPPPLAKADLPALNSLLDEILSRAPATSEVAAAGATQKLDTSRLRPQVAENLPEQVQQEPETCAHAHCGMAIRFAKRSPDSEKPEWYHDLTMQAACVRPLGEAHYKPTYATPKLKA